MTSDSSEENAVDRAAELLRQHIGLRPQSSLRSRLRRCVRDEAAAHGEDVASYVESLTVRGDAMQSLLNHITVQESGFFRHPEHFAVLARDILPRLSPPVTIWSAGCANGQEPWSLAMQLEELGIDGTVLATDLSTDALARTVAACYTTKELGDLSPQRIERHLTKTSQGWQFKPNLRPRVIALRHNLVQAPPQQVRSCQVVFCRNVLIYFAPEETRAFLSRLADAVPVAAVFLGSSETIWSVSDRYETVRAGDCYYYRPRLEMVARGGDVEPGRRSDTTRRIPEPLSRPMLPVTAPAAVPTPAVRAPRSPGMGTTPRDPGAPALGNGDKRALARAGQLALDAGDHRSAVIAFRKSVYLFPDDPLTHFSLGLAFEAAGDSPSAKRAFASARQTAMRIATADFSDDVGGFAPDELLKLLETKWQES